MDVVIIDDNKTNVLLLRHLVDRLEDGNPITFTNPVEGLDWCLGNEPDMIIVDYMMPELDGLEFISRIRSSEKMGDLPIVMVTTADLKEVRYNALTRGATDFLTKPVDTTEFVARITNLMALRRNSKRLKNKTALLAEEVAKATKDIVERENEVIFRLSKATEYRDPETGQHITRMSMYSRLIAEKLGFSDEDVDNIFRAAPMHDIGKVGITDEILLKPARLTPEEFETMKAHTTIGYAILQDSPSKLLQLAADIALTHHEKFDGSGYPRGLAKEEIPLVGRIVAVADVFDALTSERPYKKAWTVDDALGLIVKETGHQFDPKCVETFQNCMESVLEIKSKYTD
ncbi:MAG: response regulator [Alphaproteobacteria bacterium]|nr:response regulator [Rhodospirillales bacterium]MCW9045455.1 response regulator [Alphaproteobacteria bacterium]